MDDDTDDPDALKSANTMLLRLQGTSLIGRGRTSVLHLGGRGGVRSAAGAERSIMAKS